MDDVLPAGRFTGWKVGPSSVRKDEMNEYIRSIGVRAAAKAGQASVRRNAAHPPSTTHGARKIGGDSFSYRHPLTEELLSRD
ncbi:hypothetical protein [Streptomyces erythrochromogenes]|uniref:hypothetical protein n=1 Tax=Streptomyces erythrochromogenes TaxID=285574 RepID=UPI0036A50985